MKYDLSVGAVGAAVIAATISLIGLIVAKENKTSEFRQEWINSLRESIADAISAVAAMHVISDLVMGPESAALISDSWRKATRALCLVELRLNVTEDDHRLLQGTIREAEDLIRRATNGNDVSPELEALQDRVTVISQTILKREWDRVKDGESTFQITKYTLFFLLGLSFLKWFY